MAEQISKEQIHEILFMNIVIMFQTSAMQHMGKLKNPMTDKIERNLEQAQMSIDILDMLKAKTQNNLSEHETTFLNRAISELKLNFVDEVEKDKQEKDVKKEETVKEEQTEETPEIKSEEKKEAKPKKTPPKSSPKKKKSDSKK